MNNQALLSACLFIYITLVSLMFIASIQVPIFLAAGSDTLEVVIKTSNTYQWLALALFLTSWLVCFVLPKLKDKVNVWAKAALVVITLSIFFMSGHNFRYSGKQHELIDSWFFIPMQTVSVNPAFTMKNVRVETTHLSVSAYSGDTELIYIWLGLPPWRLNEIEVLNIFNDLGYIL